MPRSKPQDNRRKLGFASSLIRRAVKNITDILPWEMETEDWDKKFQQLAACAGAMLDIAEFIESLISPGD